MPNTRAAGRGRGVDLRALAGEHPQAHAAGGQVLHGVDQMGEATPPEPAARLSAAEPGDSMITKSAGLLPAPSTS